ncbi:MAG: hypothetical protein EOP40_11235 [Rubrivivax sp.]|nr:MAG: hypothetical protein EOP40_11235 [Rubrivivax sp.]
MWRERREGITLLEGLSLLRRDKRVSRRSVLIGLLDRANYRLVSTEAPDLPRDEWRDAIRWRLKDTVDFPVEDAVVDVLEVPQDVGARTSRSAIAFMAPGESPLRMALEADDAGLAWSALEVPETSLRNLSALAETPGKAHALMVFGQDHALLVITCNGELLMTRTIEVATSSLVDSEESRGGALGRAGLEVLRTLDTYERTNSNAALSGMSVVLPYGAESILEVLSELVYVSVKAYELAELVDLSALAPAPDQPARFTTLEELVVVGAALRPLGKETGRQQIDLRDTTLTAQGVTAWGAVWGLRVAGALLVVLVLASMGLSLWSRQMLTSLATVESSVMQLKQSNVALPSVPGVAELKSLQEAEQQQRRVRDALAGAIGHKGHGYADFLMALGRQAQPGLWITGLDVQDEGRNLVLSGRMTDPGFLPIYLARLQTEERFKGRRFAQLDMSVVDPDAGTSGQGITQFTLRSIDPVKARGPVKDQP